MTCIVAVLNEEKGMVYMAAERRCTDSEGRIYNQKDPKIREHKNVIFGMAGSVRGSSVAEAALVKFIDELSEPLTHEVFTKTFGDYLQNYTAERLTETTNDFSMLVSFGGRVYQIHETCEILEAEGPWAIGSGAHYALGAMYGRLNYTLELAVTAIEAACEFDSSCGGEIDIICVKTGDLQPRSDSPRLELGEDEHYRYSLGSLSQNLAPSHDLP